MKYNRVMPGAKSVYIEECIKDGFIGVDFDLKEDLSSHLTDDFKLFSKKYSPIFIKNNPEKSKVASGLASGSIWTVCHDLKRGDIVLTPDGKGEYLVGEIDSNYYYADGEILPHRRKVKWNNSTIRKNEMSQPLPNSLGSVLTTCYVTKYSDELEKLSHYF